MLYVTGDTHGHYSKIRAFCKQNPQVSTKDILIVLGDTMLNYYDDSKDQRKKRKVSAIPLTFLFVHGNHDKRPATVKGYETKEWMSGKVYVQPEFPNLLFAQDGEYYQIGNQQVLVIGGAYSVDKEYRLLHNYLWFNDEQPSEDIKQYVETNLAMHHWKVETIVSHTCPLQYLPKEALFDSIDQATVDQSTEEWLQRIADKTTYTNWYCGHFHIDKKVDKIQFLYNDIVTLG